MYCEINCHNFHVINHGIKCTKCDTKKVFSRFGFDERTRWIFTEIYCWLLALVLKDKLNSKICFYRNGSLIYHVAVFYNDFIIDITGIHSIHSFEDMCENYIPHALNGHFSIASEEDIKILLYHKIKKDKTIKDNEDYLLAINCADKIISILNKK